MKKANVFIVCIFLLMFCHCKNQPSELYNLIAKECDLNDSCQLRISTVTPYQWDRLLVCDPNIILDTLNAKLGFEYPFFEDVASRIIFTKGNLVVYHEDMFPSPDIHDGYEVLFAVPDSVRYAIFTPSNAVFNVNKLTIYNRKILNMVPVKNKN
jgi:hypothetical protein